jgi:hypothetical protein
MPAARPNNAPELAAPDPGEGSGVGERVHRALAPARLQRTSGSGTGAQLRLPLSRAAALGTRPHLRWRWHLHSASMEEWPRSSVPSPAVSTGSVSPGYVTQRRLLLPSPDLDSDLTSTPFHSSPPLSPMEHSNSFCGDVVESRRQWRPSGSRPPSSGSRLPGSSRYEDTPIHLLTISLLDLFPVSYFVSGSCDVADRRIYLPLPG